mmetsp:Transcript_10412/g.18411  ORF Transcript_10412/g.18411 Transcript_10412/m.18411 type:complete len:273 (-) Transcript_10412:259-1077(-)
MSSSLSRAVFMAEPAAEPAAETPPRPSAATADRAAVDARLRTRRPPFRWWELLRRSFFSTSLDPDFAASWMILLISARSSPRWESFCFWSLFRLGGLPPAAPARPGGSMLWSPSSAASMANISSKALWAAEDDCTLAFRCASSSFAFIVEFSFASFLTSLLSSSIFSPKVSFLASSASSCSRSSASRFISATLLSLCSADSRCMRVSSLATLALASASAASTLAFAAPSASSSARRSSSLFSSAAISARASPSSVSRPTFSCAVSACRSFSW